MNYHLRVSHNVVVKCFGQYWAEYIVRESEPDGTEPPPGVYLELQNAGYPSLSKILEVNRSLFS